MNTTLTPLSALRQGAIVPHPSWRQALSTLLEAASGGPATVALLGEAGTGKSWLLRQVGAVLQKHGRAVTFLRQGDLPWHLEPGRILLIDEASRLSARALAILSAQRTTIVILVDLPGLAAALARQPTPTPTLRLPPLASDQIAEFVSRWLQLSNAGTRTVTDDAIQRLLLHSGGTPRLVTRLLSAALAFEPGAAPITAAAIDEVAILRWSDEAKPAPAPSAPPPPAIVRPSRNRRSIAFAATVSAIAAAALLTPRVGHTPHHPALSARAMSAQADPSPLPAPEPPRPIEAASIPGPAPATATPILVAEIAWPEPLSRPAPSLARTPLPEALPPAATPVAETPIAAPYLAPVAPTKTAIESASANTSYLDTPGLIVIARRGDTLRDLYASLYRGVEPPPFEQVAAANPKPLVPGGFVVFPAPADGWPHR